MSTGQGGKYEDFELNRRRLFAVGGGFLAAACATDTSGPHAADDSGLRSAVRGRVLLPVDNGFDQARKPWNLTVDQSVRAVVELADADDASALIRYAQDAGRVLAVQPNGHNPSRAVDGTILVRTNRLNEVRIDPGTRSARVGAGVTWGQVQAAASPHGLTGVAGSSPAVGVTGYTLGGGLSWFARRFGWACDSATAFDIVDADGRTRRVTASSEPDLFWALRGGGGDYALVTALEFALYPVSGLYGGKMLWPVESAPQVMAAFREITAAAPDELTLWWSLLRMDGAPPMVGIDTTYLGDASAGRALLRSFDSIGGRIADTRRLMPTADLGDTVGEPTDPSPIRSHVELLNGLTDSDVETLLTKSMEPLGAIQIRHLGGALTRPSDSPPGGVAAPYYISLIGSQGTPDAAAANENRIQEYLAALARSRSRRTPLSLLSPVQTAIDALDPGILNRLRAIKSSWDPNGVFRSNFPVLDPVAGR
ncbi:FAD-dependent oxidoreductase [Nocardia uniformis]|uniref:FAD-dependent oxidoreductase n=1 Tax=Nocardia uniformis TaxID=53432 RepID=A0A849C7E4_9NOCA|nr:FAD-dependent oxidoreductase [Nocardia uniformis]NNH70809.1 FAD-dependent oxidoreductase [Nocardia uniformis]